jgi:hypothetical protein
LVIEALQQVSHNYSNSRDGPTRFCSPRAAGWQGTRPIRNVRGVVGRAHARWLQGAFGPGGRIVPGRANQQGRREGAVERAPQDTAPFRLEGLRVALNRQTVLAQQRVEHHAVELPHRSFTDDHTRTTGSTASPDGAFCWRRCLRGSPGSPGRPGSGDIHRRRRSCRSADSCGQCTPSGCSRADVLAE